MSKKLFLFVLACVYAINSSAQTGKNPSFEEVISLQSNSNAVISPDGKHIVFEKQSVDWKGNKFDRELWLSKNGNTPFQLTNNNEGISRNPKWSPNSEWIAFSSKRGEKTQIHIIRAEGGEASQLTSTEKNISRFEWSPDGKKIAFIQSEDKSKEEEKRKDKFGGFAVEDAEFSQNQIWLLDFNPAKLNLLPSPEQLKDSLFKKEHEAKPLIDSTSFSVNTFKWSPDGKKVAIEHQPNPLTNTFFEADISIYDMETKSLKSLVKNPSYDGLVDWSPDGKSILYGSSLNDKVSNYYKNGKFFRIDIDGTNNQQLAAAFDEDLFAMQWNTKGIFALSWQKTVRRLLSINPENGNTEILSKTPERIWNYSFSDDGTKVAFTGSNDTDLTEVYSTSFPFDDIKALTSSTKQIENWATAQSEVISWKSKDGTIIEGVLHKPQDYDANKKYPLLVIIHGGPTGVSTPGAVPSYVYPMVQWLNKGALILRPNYRGSAGYGEKFRSLNVKNLGVGDAWDVLSGVRHLEKKGIIDGNKVGSMGWSQGGYISAFLTTNSDKFKAISVGAGISNWMTYYVNTDIHPFTRQYLKATPWSDKKIYEKTSPMTNINKASTPTLIQHGENDRRVPIANAYELFQGLQDVGVETKFIIYKGFGHGITKPKERLAATWHNWQWFGKYIWGEDIEVPMD
ncbi:S9 family peptidase [Maribacter algarum]|uniref:S9 family peptidase n=1 Tax=Maribacter algarum (ex Zhang et al. 2020) TaxID=2578118 RepID=A0A5S3Q9Z7_9FLAO|nr:S9 family peptidase [Maribacter algarum]TMM53873.1 S9 family peptidase [Maribacter algarum]